MKVKSLKYVLHSIANLVLLVLLLLSAAAWRGQIGGNPLAINDDEEYAMELKTDNCQQIFPFANEVQKFNKFQYNIYDKSNNLLGYAFAYKGEKGYGGRVSLFTFTDKNDVIVGVILGKQFESKRYLRKVLKTGMLTKWNGIHRNRVDSIKVDLVSGATITSEAILFGVQNSALNQQVVRPFKLTTLDKIVPLFLLLILTFASFFPEKMMRYRTILQLLTVVIFGFWLGQFLSFVQIINWLSGGINWRIHFIMVLVVALSLVVPMVFGKAFYCTWVCPFGAAQELCGKACSKKILLPPKSAKLLKSIRKGLFLSVLLVLWLGYVFDLTMIEPFSAFSISTVSYWMLGFATFFLILSIFIPKAWCRFFCPTGFMLEWIRK